MSLGGGRSDTLEGHCCVNLAGSVGCASEVPRYVLLTPAPSSPGQTNIEFFFTHADMEEQLLCMCERDSS